MRAIPGLPTKDDIDDESEIVGDGGTTFISGNQEF